MEKKDTKDTKSAVIYYPGCTLHSRARDFDLSVRRVFSLLGSELSELPDWTCCGGTLPLVDDNLMNLVAPFRNLSYAEKQGKNLIAACAFCYNVLKRTHMTVSSDKKKLDVLKDFTETDYNGNVSVMHVLEFLKEKVWTEKIKKSVKRKLNLNVACYYGCTLVRPKLMKFDDPEDPDVMEDILSAAGFTPVDYPHKTECCGSYLIVSSQPESDRCAYRIIDSALKSGAEIIAVTCPLCWHNLDQRQDELMKNNNDSRRMPVVYFTQLLQLALSDDRIDFSSNSISPVSVLAKKAITGDRK